MEILVGTNKLSSGGARYKVKMTITHDDYFTPEFSDPDIVNDIGLIHVQTPIQFNEKVQPIKYSTNEVKADELLQISGWGYLNVYQFSSNICEIFCYVTCFIKKNLSLSRNTY